MCELWPFLSCYVDTCVSVLWCLMPFLLSLCTPVRIHWHCDWQVISSTWHMCPILIWLTCSGSFSLCPVLCAAPYYRPEVNVSRQQRSWVVVRWWHPLFSFSCAFFEVEGAGLSDGVDRCSLFVINLTNIWPHSWTTGSRGWYVCVPAWAWKKERKESCCNGTQYKSKINLHFRSEP